MVGVSFFERFHGLLLHLLGNMDIMLLAEGRQTIFSFFGSDGLITSGELFLYPFSNLVELFLGWAFPFISSLLGCDGLEERWAVGESECRGRGDEGGESGEFHLFCLCFVY